MTTEPQAIEALADAAEQVIAAQRKEHREHQAFEKSHTKHFRPLAFADWADDSVLRLEAAVHAYRKASTNPRRATNRPGGGL